MSTTEILEHTKKRKLDPRLIKVLVISAVLHVIVGLVLGGITIVDIVIASKPEFEAPDEVVQEDPPPEQKIEIKPQMQKMPASDLAMKPVENIAIETVSVDLPSMEDAFTVSAGLGGASGSLGGGLGVGTGAGSMRFPDIQGFGTTEKLAYTFEGTVYLFEPKRINSLRNDEGDWYYKYRGENRGRRQGKKIYNYVLNIPEQDFSAGFPGVTKQFEWFAIRFEVELYWPANLAGDYEFRLSSDDGAILLIDGEVVVDNDGQHGMETKTGKFNVEAGQREFEVSYYQGPKTRLGLILEYRKVGEGQWKLFSTKDLIRYQL